MNIFNINLSTKITLSFSLIGLLFIAMVLFSFSNGKQVISGLTLINNESSPVIRFSSKTNELVKATEPLVLKLLSSEVSNVYDSTSSKLNANNALIASTSTIHLRIRMKLLNAIRLLKLLRLRQMALSRTFLVWRVPLNLWLKLKQRQRLSKTKKRKILFMSHLTMRVVQMMK